GSHSPPRLSSNGHRSAGGVQQKLLSVRGPVGNVGAIPPLRSFPMLSFRKSLLATSSALAFAGHASATVLTEAFDGASTDPRAGGAQNKGLLVDVRRDQ